MPPKINMYLPYAPAIPHIHIQETNPQTKTYTSTVKPGFVVHATSQCAESGAELQKRACLRGKFTTALFLLAKGWGKPKCLANK